eukprot:m.470829 g.470829  ORF g.470829 m.470829 type:complete len:56 (+) comp30323_c0_seq1:185-352(+)
MLVWASEMLGVSQADFSLCHECFWTLEIGCWLLSSWCHGKVKVAHGVRMGMSSCF